MKRWIRDVLLADTGAVITVGYWALSEHQWLIGSILMLMGFGLWYVTHKTPERA